MSVQCKRFCAPLAFVFLLLVTACSVVQEYDTTIDKVDTQVTLFEKGLSVPLGSSNKIILSSLLNSSGQDLSEFLKTDQDGVLVLNYGGNTSLDDQIQQLKLGEMAQTDAIVIQKDFTYKFENFDPDKFTIAGDQVNVDIQLEEVNSVDMTIAPMNTNLDNLGFKAGLNKYKDVVNGNQDLNLSNKLTDLGYHRSVEKLPALTAAAIAFAPYGNNYVFNIEKELLPDVTVDATNINVKVNPITLHDDITAIKNITLSPNAQMTLSLTLTNPFITAGTLVPDVDLDLSSVFNIQGGSVLDLSSLELSDANGWHASQTYNVTGLTTTEYGSTISIDENIVLGGTVYINGAKTTINQLAQSGSMDFDLSISFSNLTINSADVSVKNIDFDLEPEAIVIGNNEPYNVPDDIKDVKEVTMDQTSPLVLTITPSNLNRLKSKSFPYTIVLQFPEEVEVKDAVGGTLTFNGNLKDGAVSHNIVIKSYHPTVTDKKVSVNAQVNVTAEVHAQNLEISSSQIPSTEAQDIAVAVSLTGTPVISDVIVTTNDIKKDTAHQDNLVFNAEGLDGLGAFTITPAGTPTLVIDFNLPSIPGLEIVPATGADAVTLVLPDLFEFDTTGLPASAVFHGESHSISLQNSVPAQISLPIKKINANPVKAPGDDVAKVTTSYSVSGKILIRSTEAGVKQSDLAAVSGHQFGIVVNIPDITAQSVDMEDGLCFNVSEKYDMSFELGAEGHITSLEEVLLDNVNFNLAATFEGLPDMGDNDHFYADLVIALPAFIEPNEIPVKGYVVNNQLEPQNPVPMIRLKNIDLSQSETIQDEVTVTGTISAEGNNISLDSIQSDIVGHIDASISGAGGKINITSAKGVFNYLINEQTNVDLADESLAALKQEGVNMDLADPQITLDLTTNLGVAMKGDITIVPVIGGEPREASKVEVKGITLPYSESASKTAAKSFVICEQAATAPEGYTVLEAEVCKLLSPLPDQLRITINAEVDRDVNSIVEKEGQYTFNIAYAINAPLAFGADFHFSTEQTMDLSSIAQFTSYGKFGIKGQAVNDSPLNLNLELVLLDAQEEVIPQTTPCILNITGAQTSNIEFMLSPQDKKAKISKGKLVITVTAVPGLALKEDSSLQLKNLVANAPEGITL